VVDPQHWQNRWITEEILVWCFLALTALAGSHRPLCDKVKDAELIVEIHFQQIAVYPEQFRQKKWAPPASELEKTRATGVVRRVFKGDIKTGEPASDSWEINMAPAGSSVAAWDRFLGRSEFSQIVFLKAEGQRTVSTGWAEESASCKSSSHRSWCPEYDDFQKQIETCLSASATPFDG
jgi:hypothetical protein